TAPRRLCVRAAERGRAAAPAAVPPRRRRCRSSTPSGDPRRLPVARDGPHRDDPSDRLEQCTTTGHRPDERDEAERFDLRLLVRLDRDDLRDPLPPPPPPPPPPPR